METGNTIDLRSSCIDLRAWDRISNMRTLLTSQRALHCRGVALFMYEYAPVLGLDARESALCGWLHDFGYLFGDNRTHAESCGLLLEQVGYRDWRQVARHGAPQGLSTPLGVLLNIADMCKVKTDDNDAWATCC